MTGIKIAPDGSIYYTNRLQNTVVRAEPGEPTSLEESHWLDNLHIAPNPTSGVLYVQLPQREIDARITMELSDITGKKLLFQDVPGDQNTLDLSGLAGGLYFLTVRHDNNSTTRKIVLNK